MMLTIDTLPIGESVNLKTLNSSLGDFRQKQLSANGCPYDKFVVGAAIFRHNTDASRDPKILLLKRAAHETYYPNAFEIPSGKVDPQDPSIKHAVVREVKEETGLDIIEFIGELKPMIYETEKHVVDASGKANNIVKSAIQLNYVVRVSDGDVILNTDEHSERYWVTEGQVGDLDITSKMKHVIREAFDLFSNQ